MYKMSRETFLTLRAVNLQVHLVNDGPVTMNLDSRKTSNVDSDETVGTQKM